jgi:hypothetical protein
MLHGRVYTVMLQSLLFLVQDIGARAQNVMGRSLVELLMLALAIFQKLV